ncbi:hypothetical protein [Pseudooceanicola sp. MF1-13]|uniref:spike base protein, RCAP_Rcc01079 family n=1 Tax=Pseudooceanicola sp. MF1-13 TaxID=3379095 RepID=UPI0038917E8A
MDPFANHSQSLDAPIRGAEAIVPDDAIDLPTLPRAIYVGAGGDISVTLADGDTVTLAAVPAGSFLPLRVSRVFTTGTTAGAMLALW